MFMSFFPSGVSSWKTLGCIAPRLIQFQYHTKCLLFCQISMLGSGKIKIFDFIKNSSAGVHELFQIFEIINGDAF